MLVRLLLCPALTGCHLDALLYAPEPPKKCYFEAYIARTVTVTSGDSTWAVRDTSWHGTVEIACPTPN